MLRLYNTALLPLRVAAGIWAALQRRVPARRVEWGERVARGLPAVTENGLWLHGASVGEARIVAALVHEIRSANPSLPISVSALTPTGRAALPEPPVVDAAMYAPLDFPGTVRRALDRIRPAGLVLVETELWPNLVFETAGRGIPVVVLNGRLSPRRMARYRRFTGLYRPVLEHVAAIGAQSDSDRSRFLELGIGPARVRVTGNIKYDLPAPVVDRRMLRSRLGAAEGRPVLVAGSTAEHEEASVLDALVRVRTTFPDLLLVLAPRHPERVNEVEALVRSRGLEPSRYSSCAPGRVAPDVVLVDTLGQLASLYAAGDLAFVGGSLVPVGGHNLLEPASAGVPVLFGPHIENFVEPARALEAAGGGKQVADGAELATVLTKLLRDPARRTSMGRRGAAVVEANRGALNRSVALLLDTMGLMGAGGPDGDEKRLAGKPS